MFWINETKIYTKSEDLGVANYMGLHVLTLALGGIYLWRQNWNILFP